MHAASRYIPARTAPAADDAFWLGANGSRFPGFGAALLRALAQHVQNTSDDAPEAGGASGDDDEADESEELFDDVAYERLTAYLAQPSQGAAALRALAAGLTKRDRALLASAGV